MPNPLCYLYILYTIYYIHPTNNRSKGLNRLVYSDVYTFTTIVYYLLIYITKYFL